MPNGTVCEKQFIINSIIDNESGVAYLECGISNPFNNATGTLATLVLTPLRSGTSTIEFGNRNELHANDRFGTNILETTKRTLILVN